MKYIQLVYRSIAVPGLAESDVISILKKSQGNNVAKGISGLLVYKGDCFLQLIEGKQANVMSLFERIAQDPRHTDVTPLWECETDMVAMPTWAMAYFSPTALDSGQRQDAFMLPEHLAHRLCEALPKPIGSYFLPLFSSVTA